MAIFSIFDGRGQSRIIREQTFWIFHFRRSRNTAEARREFMDSRITCVTAVRESFRHGAMLASSRKSRSSSGGQSESVELVLPHRAHDSTETWERLPISSMPCARRNGRVPWLEVFNARRRYRKYGMIHRYGARRRKQVAEPLLAGEIRSHF